MTWLNHRRILRIKEIAHIICCWFLLKILTVITIAKKKNNASGLTATCDNSRNKIMARNHTFVDNSIIKRMLILS